MSPEETAARVRDLVARHQLCQRELASCRRENDRLRTIVDSRPTQAQYKTLAAELEQVRRERDALLQRNRALSRTM